MKRPRRRLFQTAMLVLACASLGNCAYGQTWTEDTFADFADGTLDASGQNLYVARDGTLRTIHRFDLNDDGHIDLIFNSTHDEYGFIPATVARLRGEDGREIQVDSIAVEGSCKVIVADLPSSPARDLVFCPSFSGVQNPRRFLSIAWGQKDGWPSHLVNGVLPVRNARDVAVVDLNADGCPDIVALNGKAWLRDQPDGEIVRVYWGQKDRGYLLQRRIDLGVPGAIALASADFNGDHADDLAVLTSRSTVRVYLSEARGHPPHEPASSDIDLPVKRPQCIAAVPRDADGPPDLVIGTGSGAVCILPGDSQPKAWGTPVVFEAYDATHVAVGDLDEDGHRDIVLTNLAFARAAGGEITGAGGRPAEAVRILWGAERGCDVKRSTALPVPMASATAIGDLDGDGHADLAVAVYQSERSFSAESLLFFHAGDRTFVRCKQGIPTKGATDVAILPGSEARDGGAAVFCNSRGGSLHEKVPLMVYWGGRDGFDPQRRWLIPFASGYESSAADLNVDGYVDLIAMSSAHGGRQLLQTNRGAGANIFWGGKNGFDLEGRRTVLPHYGLWASNVADLDRDGWLDLVLCKFGPDQEGESEELIVYYGGAGGFDAKRRVVLPCPGRSAAGMVADFNRDAWLDIAVTSYAKDRVRVFWGGPNGFDAARQQKLDLPAPIGLETADLNADGWLDLIAGSYIDPLAHHHDTGVTIFWGGEAGFAHWKAQWLPGWTATGMVVADFDADGHLDLFCPHYHGELTREAMPCYLYWGGPDGLKKRRRTILRGDSADDGLAADFDQDGKLDLAVVCHTRDGDHRALSRVYYNDGNRFTHPRVQLLPTHGAHWMWLQDMGHIYDRSWRQRYDSSVFAWNDARQGGTIRAKAAVPPKASVELAVRSAPNEGILRRRDWRPVEDDGAFTLSGKDRAMQYRLTLVSENGDRYPIVDRVDVSLHDD